MRWLTFIAVGVACLLSAAAEAQNGNSAEAKRKRDQDRQRMRAGRRLGPNDTRVVGPQLDGQRARGAEPNHGATQRDLHRQDLRRRAGLDHDPSEHPAGSDDSADHLDRHRGLGGGPRDRTVDDLGADALGDDMNPRGGRERGAREAERHRRFRQQLADIDRLRDAAVERGDVDALRRADDLERELRDELRYHQQFEAREPHVPRGNGPDGEGPPGWLRRGELPPGQDPNRLPPGRDPNYIPPGHDPNRLPRGRVPGQLPPGIDPNNLPPGFDPNNLPPGIDPSNQPPGLGRAMERRFQGRFELPQLPPPEQPAVPPVLPDQLPPPE